MLLGGKLTGVEDEQQGQQVPIQLSPDLGSNLGIQSRVLCVTIEISYDDVNSFVLLVDLDARIVGAGGMLLVDRGSRGVLPLW